MCPKEAKIFLVEDCEEVRESFKTFLKVCTNHRVVLEAGTVAEAKALSERIPELGIDVAIIDGNLTPMDLSGADGEEVNLFLKKNYPQVNTIGKSASTQGVRGVDINLSNKASPEDVAKTIDDI